MPRYIGGRLLQALIVMWGVSAIVFVLIHVVPGDPGRIALGEKASSAAVASLDHQLGLDRGLPAQYVLYMGRLFRGDLGTSIQQHVSVTSLIGPRAVASLLLVAYALVLAMAAAGPLAVIAATRRNRGPDHAIRLVSVLAYAMPPFWFGLILALLFGLEWHLLPTSGYGDTPATVLKTLTLPAMTIAFFVAPLLVRTLRSSIVSNLSSEHAEAARARGLGGRRVLRRYVVRNSLISTVTLLGISVGSLLSLAVVVEQVFAIPGLGSLLVTSVVNRDFPTVQGLTLVFAFAVVVANLAADLLYVVLDPRVRL